RGTNSRKEERLICVDISDASQESLVEQSGLDGHLSFVETGAQDFFRHQECVRPQLVEALARLSLRQPLHFSKFPDVTESESPAPGQMEDEVYMSVLEKGARDNLPRHAEVQ